MYNVLCYYEICIGMPIFCTNSLKILTLTFLHIFIYMCLLHMYLSCDCNISNLIYIDLMLDFILTTHSYPDFQIT